MTLRLLCLAASMLASLGCGAAATEQQLKRLQSDVVRLKADNAVLSQRLGALESHPVSGPGKAAVVTSVLLDAPPELAVVTLRPRQTSSGASGDAPELAHTILEPGPNGEVLEKTAPQPASQP